MPDSAPWTRHILAAVAGLRPPSNLRSAARQLPTVLNEVPAHLRHTPPCPRCSPPWPEDATNTNPPAPPPTSAWCPALHEGRCSTYDLRPAICRGCGVVDGMLCPHGCPIAEGFAFINAAAAAGTSTQQMTVQQAEQTLATPEGHAIRDWLTTSERRR
ncbi:hypothetical protein ACQEVF_57900 [Nonomuraea polychroma]|uniref:hypothetical protein n=1 Tax=Nonomuraea polychroma TaxID=46176 RepID=UPI003D8A686B